jgi:hypothetical protein
MHFSRILAVLAAGAFVSASPMRDSEEMKTAPGTVLQHEQATNHMMTSGMDRSAHGEEGMMADGMMRTSKADSTMRAENKMGAAGMSGTSIHERADATHDIEWNHEKMRGFDNADHAGHAFNGHK